MKVFQTQTKSKKVQNKRVIDQLHFNENIVIENISYKYQNQMNTF